MKLELLVAAQCPECRRAEAIWQRAAEEYGLPFSILDVDNPAGKAIRVGLALQMVPAILFDGKLVGVGVQSPEQAGQMILAAHDKPT